MAKRVTCDRERLRPNAKGESEGLGPRIKRKALSATEDVMREA
jgi:hypothetical protein